MSPASDPEPPDCTPPRTTSDPAHAADPNGDPRWPGPTRDDLLGQRARVRPTGGVDSTAVSTTAGDVPAPELPALEDDVYLLEPDAREGRSRRAAVLGSLHALALDTALSAGGDAVWIDAGGHATTRALARVAPSGRALDRVHVARAFTTHQHHALVAGVGRWLRDGTESPFGTPATDRPAVLVCPALDALYRAGDLRAPESRALLARALATLGAVARECDLPVLVTRTRGDDYAAPIERAATTIALERTQFGPRFACDALAFETLAYPVDDGVLQTTLAFWREIIASRHPGVATATDDAGRPTATAGPGADGR